MIEYVFKVGRLYRGRYKLDLDEKMSDVPLRTQTNRSRNNACGTSSSNGKGNAMV